MTQEQTIKDNRVRRARRARIKVRGTAQRPRLTVHRSSKYVSCQLIDDQAGRTLLTVTEKMLGNAQGTKTERALALGLQVAEKAKALNITQVVFDRGASAFHGRVKAVADGAKKGGLTI